MVLDRVANELAWHLGGDLYCCDACSKEGFAREAYFSFAETESLEVTLRKAEIDLVYWQRYFVAVGILIISENKKAWHDYLITDKFEAGLVLTGSEVKSLRNRQVQLKDSFIAFKGHEAFLQNAHISEYKQSSYNNHEPERHRKLLLHAAELEKIYAALREKGLTCVALKIYFKNGRAKLEIALAKGKKAHDKREAIKKKDVDAQLRKTLQRDRR